MKGHGAKVDAEGHLVVPARDAGGRLWGVQVFHADGKRFIKNSHKVGTMHAILAWGGGKLGDIAAGKDAIVIGEGYAALAKIHEARGFPLSSPSIQATWRRWPKLSVPTIPTWKSSSRPITTTPINWATSVSRR